MRTANHFVLMLIYLEPFGTMGSLMSWKVDSLYELSSQGQGYFGCPQGQRRGYWVFQGHENGLRTQNCCTWSSGTKTWGQRRGHKDDNTRTRIPSLICARHVRHIWQLLFHSKKMLTFVDDICRTSSANWDWPQKKGTPRIENGSQVPR